jgi:hypothetical protein
MRRRAARRVRQQRSQPLLSQLVFPGLRRDSHGCEMGCQEETNKLWKQESRWTHELILRASDG